MRQIRRLADEYGAVIGERVTVGHGAIVHACQIGDDCLIGMQATVLDGAEVGDGTGADYSSERTAFVVQEVSIREGHTGLISCLYLA